MFPVPLTENDIAGYRILASLLCLTALASRADLPPDPIGLAGRAATLADAWLEVLELHPPQDNGTEKKS